ncbi:MAG TPA: hypothetical protein VF384_07375 [Planctomycetota bacterium]
MKSVRLGAAGTFVAAASYLALGGVTVTETANAWANLHGSVTTVVGTNNPGPYITFNGALALGAIDAVLIFRNNEQGTHEREEPITVRVPLCPAQVIQFNKQPPLGGVGGNPFIFLQLFDEGGDPISDKVLLGRIVQGVFPVDLDFGSPVGILAQIAGSCSNSPGPFITLDGDLTFSGVTARLIFQNSPHANAPHQREETVELNVELTPPGGVIQFSKQPPLGGVGGNPRIWVRFESNGESSDEIYLGRCVQLSRQ